MRLHAHQLLTTFGFIILALAIFFSTRPLRANQSSNCAYENARTVVGLYYAEERARLVRERDQIIENALPASIRGRVDKLSLAIKKNESDRESYAREHPNAGDCAQETR